jgi:hypothetical protein
MKHFSHADNYWNGDDAKIWGYMGLGAVGIAIG